MGGYVRGSGWECARWPHDAKLTQHRAQFYYDRNIVRGSWAIRYSEAWHTKIFHSHSADADGMPQLFRSFVVYSIWLLISWTVSKKSSPLVGIRKIAITTTSLYSIQHAFGYYLAQHQTLSRVAETKNTRMRVEAIELILLAKYFSLLLAATTINGYHTKRAEIRHDLLIKFSFLVPFYNPFGFCAQYLQEPCLFLLYSLAMANWWRTRRNGSFGWISMQ